MVRCAADDVLPRRVEAMSSLSSAEVAVDDVLTLTNLRFPLDLYQVIDRHEAKAPGAAFFRRDIRDAGNPPNVISDPKIAVEAHRAARPHASRKHDWRQKAAARGMSVCAKNSGERGGLTETEVKQRRRNVAKLCRSLPEIECRPEPSNENRR